MSNSTRIGGVTVQFNEDGTLFIYQPDSSRVMGPELAEQLTAFLIENVRPDTGVRYSLDEVEAEFSTVPAGVINTSAGPALDALTQQAEADNLAAIREEFGPEVQAPAPAPKRRGRPPRKTP